MVASIPLAPNFAFEHAARARPSEGRRAAARPEQRVGHPQRQRTDFTGLDAQVRRGFRAVRPDRRRDQAVLRDGRGDAICVHHRHEGRSDGHPRRPGRVEQGQAREGCRGLPQRGAAGVLRTNLLSTSGRPSSTPTPPRNCPTGTSARSGCTATTWVLAIGTENEKTAETFKNILKSRPTRRMPKVRLTTRCGCAPATSARSSTASSTSPAGSRSW